MSKHNAYEEADLSGYGTGNCDIMAIALHRLTGLPFGLWGARFQDDMCEEDEFEHEYAHAVVIVDENGPITMDAWGLTEGVPERLYFSQGTPGDAALFPAGEEDVRCAFTVMEINEQAIEAAMAIVSCAAWIEPYLIGDKSRLSPRPKA